MVETLEQIIRQAVGSNQFLSGGLVLMVFGAGIAMLPRLGKLLLKIVERQLVVHAEIRDPIVIGWLDQYLQESGYGRHCRALKVTLDYPPDETVPAPVLAPGIGSHLLRHRGRFFHLQRDMDSGPGKNGGGDALSQLLKQDVIHLRTLGRSRVAVDGLIAASRDHHVLRHEGDERATLYINVNHRDWTAVRVGRFRPLESVVLRDGLVEDMLQGIREFQKARDWYARMGIPYRYGFSLEGPPGGGKSSVVKAIAGELGMRLYVLDLNAPYLSDVDVMMLLANLPANSLVLVEDIDCDGLQRQQAERSDGGTRVTLKGFLNAVDGVAAGEGRVLVITTNHPEALDDAMMRKGRIDERYVLGPATQDQAARIFRRFFPEADGKADVFADGIPAGVSMAAVQGHLIRHASDLDAAAHTPMVVEPMGTDDPPHAPTVGTDDAS